MDGEGTITMSRFMVHGRPSPKYKPMVGTSNSVYALLEPFPREYGGKIHRNHEKRTSVGGGKWADMFFWNCPDATAVRFLTDILPYLISKRVQAKLVIQFLTTKQNLRQKRQRVGSRGGSAPLTSEELLYRGNLYDEIHFLNKRGSNPLKLISLEERILQ